MERSELCASESRRYSGNLRLPFDFLQKLERNSLEGLRPRQTCSDDTLLFLRLQLGDEKLDRLAFGSRTLTKEPIIGILD
jgi:hypothetical protein